ncbi:MAG: DUF2147 domain-containing protein [Ginsengibacter sp.]
MKHKFISCFVALQLFSICLLAQIKADGILGIWETSGKEPAKIEVYKSLDKYYGKIIWLKYPNEKGSSKLDKNNPDKKKQNQQIIGLLILTELSFDSDEWSDGKIYDPESGNTYSCYISIKNKTTLKVRGYLGISLFGRTEFWSKGSL